METKNATAVSLACSPLCRQLRAARIARDSAASFAVAANAFLDGVQEAKVAVFDKLYDDIQGAFSGYYRKLHKHENEFEAELRQHENSLLFEVDFHGKGRFPPTALHSEGHQDSMGLCLYLALMERLTQNRLQLTVLDDVVMSIDAEHRRPVCTLLKEDFAGRQFFLTTHDPLWAQQLVRSGLIDKHNQIEIQGWTLEEGAIVAPDGWDKLDELLKVGDVPHAAFALRRLLEAELADSCLALAARVRYREQGRYDCGELLEGATARFGEFLRKARAAAESWGRDNIVQQIETRRAAFDEAKAVLERERWIVNPTVHHNPGHDVHPNDLGPVVEATRNLLKTLRCAKPGCESLLGLAGGNDGQMLKCRCGEVGWTLEKRKSQAEIAS